MFKCLNDKNGFTLIEGVVGVAVFLIISLALFSIFGIIFGTIRNNKARITANSVALEQLEIIRSMKFGDVATDTGWVPAGPIPSERILNRAGFNFTVQTDIAFVDDEYDGLDPDDSFPYDYKKARVRVLWTNPVSKNQETVAMSTTVVPKGLEGLSPNKGGLFIVVFNASGETVSGANVHIESDSADYSTDAVTDLNGNLWVPDLEPSDDYHIVATKNGYSTDQTYPVDNDTDSPTYNPNPVKPDAVVVADEVTKLGFAIDVLGSLNIKTVNYNNPQNWKINTDLGADSQTEVALDIGSGDNIFLVWLDDRSGADRIYAQKYRYNSSTGLYEKQWADDVQITTANNKKSPRVATFGTNYFYAIWSDARNGNQDVYLQKFNSADGSAVWNDVKVNVDANNADQMNPDLAVDSAGNVYVVWMDDRNGDWDIYAQRYDSDGNNLWVFDMEVKRDSGVAIDQENPKVVVDDEDNFYVVWEDDRNGNKDIFLSKFDGNANTLFTERRVNTDSSGLDQYEPAIVFDGTGYLYISWSDKRNSQPDIYAQKYDKDGNIAASGNWTSGDVKINDDSLPDAWRTNSAVAFFSDSAIYFSWEDDRNGNPDVYSTKFNSDGGKLWSYDLIMNSSSSEVQEAPDVVVDSEGYGVTVWNDYRNGNSDIYAARYRDLGFFTRVGVPITVTGAKLKGTYPNDSPPPDYLPIYKYSKTFTSDANGNINIGDGVNEIEWDNYSFSTDEDHTIISTDQPTPLAIDPGETESVVINVEP
jgi:type II secretory pathway pseudopilin PulG